MSSSDIDKAKAKSNDALSTLFNSPIDAAITRIVKILSTAAGVDSTFCLVGYGAVFTSAQLQLLSQFVEKTEFKARLISVALSAKNLGALCSDVRTFLRLWGLLKIYLGAKAAYLAPPKDGLLKLLSWSQLASMAGYFFYENSAYLAGKGVLRGAGFTHRIGPEDAKGHLALCSIHRPRFRTSIQTDSASSNRICASEGRRSCFAGR